MTFTVPSLVLPYPNPAYIYTGTDPSQFEQATGTVTNRAPTQIQANINYVFGQLQTLYNSLGAFAIDGGSASGVNNLVQLRRDTAANWTSKNPILSLGEIGIEDDTKNIKIGDGTTAWTVLPYNFGQSVDNVSNQTIGGNKTFNNSIIGNLTGNAATASKLKAPVTINGVVFDGSQSITINATDSSGSFVDLVSGQSIGGIKTFTSQLNVGNGVYDATNNTYYLKPATTSVLNVVKLSQLISAGIDLTLSTALAPANLGINSGELFNITSFSNFGAGSISYTATDSRLFSISADTNTSITLRASATAQMKLSAQSVGITSDLYVSGSVYDNANAAYYLKPSGNSVLNSVTISNIFASSATAGNNAVLAKAAAGTVGIGLTAFNTSTGGNVTSNMLLQTGTANSTVTASLNDNNGAPVFTLKGGAAVSVFNYNVTNHYFNDLAGANILTLTDGSATFNVANHTQVGNTITTINAIKSSFSSSTVVANTSQETWNEVGIAKASILTTLNTDGSSQFTFKVTQPGAARNTDTRLSVATVLSNQWQFTTSAGIAAKYLYDSDNTSYYVKPSNSSIMNNLTVTGSFTSYNGIYNGNLTSSSLNVTGSATINNNLTVGSSLQVDGNINCSNSVYAAGLIDSQNGNYWIHSSQGSVLNALTVNELTVNGKASYNLAPHYTVSIAPSASYTTPSQFNGAPLQGDYTSRGSIQLYAESENNDSYLFTMVVQASQACSFDGYLAYTDDSTYIYINGNLVESYSSGSKGQWPVFSLAAGQNTIQIVHNNSQGNNCNMSLWADFFQNGVVSF